MIIIDLKADNLFSFSDFHVNFAYSGIIEDSLVPEDHVAGRPDFPYRKINIISGSNASGKTTLGRMVKLVVDFLRRAAPTTFGSEAPGTPRSP